MKLVSRPSPPPTPDPGIRATPMPFGPFNGRPVCELPCYYLYSLLNKRLWAGLQAAVDAELEYRAGVRRTGKRAA